MLSLLSCHSSKQAPGFSGNFYSVSVDQKQQPCKIKSLASLFNEINFIKLATCLLIVSISLQC